MASVHCRCHPKHLALMNDETREIDDVLAVIPKSETIRDNIIKAWYIVNNPDYKHILCSNSGGSDSAVLMHLMMMVDTDKKTTYAFYDTGIEYKATKKYLDRLEEWYGVKIERHKSEYPVPKAVKTAGYPFLSKRVSDYISRLQKHGFKWENEPLDVLMDRYCQKADPAKKEELKRSNKKGWYLYKGEYYRGCVTALRWWTNDYESGSRFNIGWNAYLKEFMTENPPQIKISDKCCYLSKKGNAKSLCKEYEHIDGSKGFDLNVYGVRKAEGGSRVSYQGCFTYNGEKDPEDETELEWDEYRPLFHYKDTDKTLYSEAMDIEYSDCYTVYGLIRTGCAGCPFAAAHLERELNILRYYEPKLYKAVMKIFGPVYDYQRKYREFCEEQEGKYHQLTLFDVFDCVG